MQNHVLEVSISSIIASLILVMHVMVHLLETAVKWDVYAPVQMNVCQKAGEPDF